MGNKIQITPKQAAQFNQMLMALKKIAKDYYTTSQLRKNSTKKYHLDFEDAIEMAYENIQIDAATAVSGVKPLVLPN